MHFDFLFHRNTMEDITGDIQGVSNIGYDDGEHLYELYFEQALGDAGSSLKLGLFDLNAEFDAVETAGLFLNSSHGQGIDFAQGTELHGVSASPLTAVGARGAWQIDEQWKLMLAAVDGVPGKTGDDNRTNHVRLREADGALLAAELNYLPAEGQRLGLGAWHFTRQDHELKNPAKRDHSQGMYAFADLPLAKSEQGELRGFVRAGIAEESVNVFGEYYGAGIVHTCHLLNEGDQLGLAIAHARLGDDSHDALFDAAVAEAGAPIPDPFENAETAIELSYRTQVTPWLAVQPDLQYIVNPGTAEVLDDALVVGLRLEAALSTAD